jgi:pyruvate formate lyase activating enzyme
MMESIKADRAQKGIVFDIERFSIHNGYGIRTLVFLKGCPLKCEWCSNPESQNPRPQLGFFVEKCSSCLQCTTVCPNGEYFKNNHKVDWENCMGCLKCVDACLYGARVVYGKTMTVGEVVDIVKRDMTFYKKSGGGMTLGGGEATFQPAFAEQILKGCKEAGIHTALETCGFTSWDKLSSIIRYVDLLLFDIKNMDSGKHKQFTGVGNEMILENAKKASKFVKEMIVRFPLIPDFNDSRENGEAMGRFIAQNMPEVKKIDILPYHSTGESKSLRIGKAYMFKHTSVIDDAKIQEFKGILESFGLKVSIGG